MSSELATMSIGDMTQLATAVAASKLFGMQSPEQALVLMAICQSEGKSPIQATKIYHIINGRPSMRADAMQAEFQARGGEIEFLARDEKVCEATFTWGKTRVTVKWTIEMANAAGLTAKGGPWKTAPRSMLHARCVSEGVRAVMPGVVSGIYTPEEIEDIEAEILPPATPAPRTIAPTPAPRAIAPARSAAPALPPDWDPRGEFIELAKERGFDILSEEGKPSASKIVSLLRQVFGDTTISEIPRSKDTWNSALKALEVFQPEADALPPSPPAPAPSVPTPAAPVQPTPSVDLSDLEDPFA